MGATAVEPLVPLAPDHPSPAVQVETLAVDHVIVVLSPLVSEEEVALNESVGVETGGVVVAGGGVSAGVEMVALTDMAMV